MVFRTREIVAYSFIVVLWFFETAYFGYNVHPQSDSELFADLLVGVTFIVTFAIFNSRVQHMTVASGRSASATPNANDHGGDGHDG